MNYTLMHQNTPVMELEIDEVTGAIVKNGVLYRQSHLPIGIPVSGGRPDRGALNDWWRERAIPASRSGLRDALREMQIASPQLLLTKCLGLSLSDQYWVRPVDSGLVWEQVNFFDNPFSDDVGDVLLGRGRQSAAFDFSSPDNTSDGCLRKRWKILDGRRYLIKGGSDPFQQQPFNEVIACKVMERLNVDHVDYRLFWDGDMPYSLCPDFVTRETELVPAWRVMLTQKQRNDTSVYQHYCNCCQALGVEIVPFLDRMIVVDYLIANEDRHAGNFGLLRRADTLDWLGPAPIYDSGSSLGYSRPESELGRPIISRPFSKRPDKQLALVTSFDWLDFSRLNGIGEEVRDILAEGGRRIRPARREAIASGIEARIRTLEAYAQERNRTHSFRQQLESAAVLAKEQSEAGAVNAAIQQERRRTL